MNPIITLIQNRDRNARLNIPTELLSDPELVAEALHEYWIFSEIANALLVNFMDNEAIMLRFIHQYPAIYYHASARLQESPEFTRQAILSNPKVLDLMSLPALRRDESLFRELMKQGQYTGAIKMHSEAKTDHDLNMLLLKLRPQSLMKSPISFRSKPGAMITAITIGPNLYAFITGGFKASAMLGLKVIKGGRIDLLPRRLRDQYQVL